MHEIALQCAVKRTNQSRGEHYPTFSRLGRRFLLLHLSPSFPLVFLDYPKSSWLRWPGRNFPIPAPFLLPDALQDPYWKETILYATSTLSGQFCIFFYFIMHCLWFVGFSLNQDYFCAPGLFLKHSIFFHTIHQKNIFMLFIFN